MNMAILKRSLLPALVFAYFFYSPITAAAGGIDHPAPTLTRGGVSLGFEVDLSSRDVKFSDKKVEERNRAYGVKIGYGLMDRVNLFGLAGGESVEDDEGFNGKPGRLFGGGAKIRLYQLEDTTIGLTAQYRRFSSRDDDVAGISGFRFESTWNVYDVALGGSTRISDSSFYGGLLFSTVNGVVDASSAFTPSEKAHFKESSPVGLFFGGDSELAGRLRAGVELRLINETSLTLRLNYPFGGQ